MKLALLIGVGSVGKRHLDKLSNKYDLVYAVDPNKKAREFVVDKFPSTVMLSDTKELKQTLPVGSRIDCAIIANWASDRALTIRDLKKYKVDRFLFEKPLASSLLDIQRIERIVRHFKASGMVNLHLRHSQIPQIVSDVTEKYSLGNIVSIVEHGGAKCFGTNGIHWLDLASHLIGERPNSVSAKVEFDSISPRGPQFLVAEGFGVWSYPGGAKFHLIYSNSSSTPSVFRIQWKHAMGTIIDGIMSIEIQTSKIENPNSPITRTPNYDLKLEFHDIFFEEEAEGTFGRVHDFLLNQEPSLEHYSNSSKDLLCAFISSALNKEIDLSKKELLALRQTKLFRRDWQIT